MNQSLNPPFLSSSAVAGAVDRAAFARRPLPPWALRTIAYMSDIEHHTIAYLRELLATRAVDDPRVAEFLACWFYEETAHGRALAEVLDACGHVGSNSPRRPHGLRARGEAMAIAAISGLWPGFVALHMTWGAINELTALTAYRRLAARADHPALSDLIDRIARDESRHFGFYFAQARQRLAASPRARAVVRALVDRFWAPVGSGVRPDADVRFLAEALFAGADGRAAAQLVDRTIRRLPGFADAPLVDAWLDRHTL